MSTTLYLPNGVSVVADDGQVSALLSSGFGYSTTPYPAAGSSSPPEPVVVFPLQARPYTVSLTDENSVSFTYSESIEAFGALFVGAKVTDWGDNATYNSAVNLEYQTSFDGEYWSPTAFTGLTGAVPVDQSFSTTDENTPPYMTPLAYSVRYFRVGYYTVYDDQADPPQTDTDTVTFEVSILARS